MAGAALIRGRAGMVNALGAEAARFWARWGFAASRDHPLVLFRSGFVEEDVPPVGRPGEVTMAPLRSPGRPLFEWPVTSLTFRWDNPARQAYFDTVIAPAIEGRSRFFVLSPTFSAEPATYVDQFMRWVEDTWPGRFTVDALGYGSVALIVDVFALARANRERWSQPEAILN